MTQVLKVYAVVLAIAIVAASVPGSWLGCTIQEVAVAIVMLR